MLDALGFEILITSGLARPASAQCSIFDPKVSAPYQSDVLRLTTPQSFSPANMALRSIFHFPSEFDMPGPYSAFNVASDLCRIAQRVAHTERRCRKL
jgi:hypothetical protein